MFQGVSLGIRGRVVFVYLEGYSVMGKNVELFRRVWVAREQCRYAKVSPGV
jgi:hypothetical protein